MKKLPKIAMTAIIAKIFKLPEGGALGSANGISGGCLRVEDRLFMRDFPVTAILAILAIVAMPTGCGYHTAGHADRLPATLRVIAVPGFKNQTQTYRIEQILTRDVVREFIARTSYQVVNSASDSADATLKGTVVSTVAAPLTYDSQTGRASSEIVTITLKVSLVDRSGRVLFENQNYTFRDVYQVSREIASFFDEETPALQRMSRDFARTLVSDILEAY